MPNGTVQHRRDEAVRLRESGMTFDAIAGCLGFRQASNARHAYRQGMAQQGRPIPTRQIRVRHNNRVTTVTAPVLVGFTTLNTMTFGIELEIASLYQSQAAAAMHSAGMVCNDNGYTHRDMTEWKVVPDGSVSNGCEVVSPVLTGNDGLTEIRTVAGILRAAGATVNETCGMHIHIGVDGVISPMQQARVIVAHQVWQAAFDALLTKDRLRDCNESLPSGRTNYARKRTALRARALSTRWVNGDRTPREVADAEQRYFALNVNAFHKYGTFEVRSHQGSTNGMNATAWIAFNTAFIQWAKYVPISDSGFTGVTISDNGGYDQAAADKNAAGKICKRSAQVDLCHQLADILLAASLITVDLYDYICSRAGNARNTQNGSN